MRALVSRNVTPKSDVGRARMFWCSCGAGLNTRIGHRWSESGWRSRILSAPGSGVPGMSIYLSRESTKLYGGQGPRKSSLTDSLEWT
jgi:hypothetical protein